MVIGPGLARRIAAARAPTVRGGTSTPPSMSHMRRTHSRYPATTSRRTPSIAERSATDAGEAPSESSVRGGVHPLVGAVDHQPPARRQRPVRGQVGEGAQARDAGERLRRGEGGVRALELVEGAADGTQAHQIGAEGTLQLAHPLAGDAHRGAHAVEGPAAEDALAVHEGGPGIAGHEQPDVAVGGGENRGGRVKAGVGGAGCAARCRVHVITPEWGTVGQATR